MIGVFMIDEDKLRHSIAVARLMMKIGNRYKLDNEKLQSLFILGFNHDVGYEFDNAINHGIVAGNLLKNDNYKYWREIYYHGKFQDEYDSMFLRILNDVVKKTAQDRYSYDFSCELELYDVQKEIIKFSEHIGKRLVLFFDDAAHIGRETGLEEFFDIFKT